MVLNYILVGCPWSALFNIIVKSWCILCQGLLIALFPLFQLQVSLYFFTSFLSGFANQVTTMKVIIAAKKLVVKIWLTIQWTVMHWAAQKVLYKVSQRIVGNISWIDHLVIGGRTTNRSDTWSECWDNERVKVKINVIKSTQGRATISLFDWK